MLESNKAFNSLPWFADNALLLLVEVKLSSTVIFTVESTNPFNTFPCSADKGTVVPPVVKSSIISVISTLAEIAVTFVAIFVVLSTIAAACSVVIPTLAVLSTIAEA